MIVDTAVPGITRSRAVLATRRIPPTWLFAAFGAFLGALEFLLVHHALVDDAYITLDYVRTLALHGQWGMVPGLTSNTATSPLNVLVQAAATVVVRDAVRAAGVVLVGLLALSGWWLAGIGDALGLPRWRMPVLGVGFLATMPLLLSTVGLESYLAATVLIGLVRYVLVRQWWIVGVLAGAMALTRPDLFVFGVVAVLIAGRSCWKVAAAAIATALPWWVFSWYAIGSALPDSMLLKTGIPWGIWTYANGFGLWYGIFPVAVLLSVIPAAIGLVCLPLWIRAGRPVAVIWGVGGLAHIGLFILLSPAPYHWYYAPALTALGLVAVATAARFAKVGVVLVGALVLTATGLDVSTGIPRRFVPISSNWATAAQYQALARTLPAKATVAPPGEIGTLAYYCDCRVLDGFADRGYMPQLLAQRSAEATPFVRRLLALNYRHFHPTAPQPVDYRIEAPLVPVEVPHTLTGAWGDQRHVTVIRVDH